MKPGLREPFTGLRGRMLLALVATSIATLGAAALVVVEPLEHRIESDRLVELRGLARTIRPALSDLPSRDARPGAPRLQQLVDRLQRRAGGRIAVYDSRGTKLADTATARESADPVAGDPARLRAVALRRRDGVFAGRHGDDAFAATVVGKPNRLTLVVTKRLTDSRAAAAVMRAAMPTAAAAGLAVAVLLALLLSASMMRRLGRLRADAETLGASGLGHPVAVTGADEVTVVARALEQMRARLLAAETSRQAFLATASHELRTPLASLQATLELLREDLQTGSTSWEAADRRTDLALRQTRRLTSLATDLLDISRVDGEVPLRREPVELSELVGLIAGEFTDRLGADARRLVVEAHWVVVDADPGAVARILRILLDNADHHGAGAVTVTVTSTGGDAHVMVTDEGAGIADDERELVFERFARGHAANGASGGAGLGLAIARGLARAMGGDLEAQSASTGGRIVLTLRQADEVPT